MYLSKNLKLEIVLKSVTALRYGIDNTPSIEHRNNLVILAENIFQPIVDYFKVPIYISSGYRSEELNKRIGGSKTSDHCKGMAIDIDQDFRSSVTNREVFDFISKNLSFKQLIWEYGDNDNPDWVHVSYDYRYLPREILRSKKVNKKTRYIYM